MHMTVTMFFGNRKYHRWLACIYAVGRGFRCCHSCLLNDSARNLHSTVQCRSVLCVERLKPRWFIVNEMLNTFYCWQQSAHWIQFKDLDDEAVACIAIVSGGAILIAQEGLNCAVDGFMRLLTRIDLEQIESAIGVLASERYACVLNNAQNFDWIFLRSPDQVDRFLAVLQRLGVSFFILQRCKFICFWNCHPHYCNIN